MLSSEAPRIVGFWRGNIGAGSPELSIKVTKGIVHCSSGWCSNRGAEGVISPR